MRISANLTTHGRSRTSVAGAASRSPLPTLSSSSRARAGSAVRRWAEPENRTETSAPGPTESESQDPSAAPSWFDETRAAATQTTKPKSKFVDRPDLVSKNWDGDVYVGEGVDILTVILGFAVGVPAIGLIFAYFTWGELWGT